MVNLDLYRVFYTVAKSGSLTKAAEELNYAQSTITSQLNEGG